MKLSGLWLSLLVAMPLTVSGQVTIEVVQEQDQFLQGEALPVAVRIINRSGRTLHLGEEEDWLTFTIEPRDGGVVSETGHVPVVGAFDLESSHVGTKRLNLQPYFDLSQPGRYAIRATVKVKGWGAAITSGPKGFDVIEGIHLWEQAFGVPTPAATNGAPEVRKYILQQANYLKSQLRLYVRITDGTGGRTVAVCPVGIMLSFSRPEVQLDAQSNLHLLYQVGPHAFSYSVYSPDGELLVRQTHDYVQQSRPRLQAKDDGGIAVAGGVRRVTRADVPPAPEPTPSEANEEKDKPTPSVSATTTNAPKPSKSSKSSKPPKS